MRMNYNPDPAFRTGNARARNAIGHKMIIGLFWTRDFGLDSTERCVRAFVNPSGYLTTALAQARLRVLSCCFELVFVQSPLRFFSHLLIVRSLFLFRAPDREQFCMAWRKDVGLNKIEPVDVQPVSHNFTAVLLAKLAEVIRVNQLSLQAVGPDSSRF